MGVRMDMTHLPHRQNRMFATVPHALDVDRLGEVPDLLLGVDRVVVATRGLS